MMSKSGLLCGIQRKVMTANLTLLGKKCISSSHLKDATNPTPTGTNSKKKKKKNRSNL